MNRCQRGADNIPEGMFYDCENDVFLPIPTQMYYLYLLPYIFLLFTIYLLDRIKKE